MYADMLIPLKMDLVIVQCILVLLFGFSSIKEDAWILVVSFSVNISHKIDSFFLFFQNKVPKKLEV